MEDNRHSMPVNNFSKYLSGERFEEDISSVLSLGLVVALPAVVKSLPPIARGLGGIAKRATFSTLKGAGKLAWKGISSGSSFIGKKITTAALNTKAGRIGLGVTAVSTQAYHTNRYLKKRKQRGLPHDNLGATGDLTLGLHNGK